MTKNKIQINVYPNPLHDNLFVSFQQQNVKQASFTIRNILGQTVFTKQETNLKNTNTTVINMRELVNGIYFLDIIVDGERAVKKIVKE